MSVIYEQKNKHYIFSKGAPEILVENCKYYINKSGDATHIDATWREEFRRIISLFSSDSLRCLLLCYRELSGSEAHTD